MAAAVRIINRSEDKTTFYSQKCKSNLWALMGIWLWIKANSDAVTDVIVFIPNQNG